MSVLLPRRTTLLGVVLGAAVAFAVVSGYHTMPAHVGGHAVPVVAVMAAPGYEPLPAYGAASDVPVGPTIPASVDSRKGSGD
jgi:hypothetical protein